MNRQEKKLLRHIFFRSFFIQAGYNIKSMLSIGFAYSIEPLGKILFGNDRKKRLSFLRRQLNFFNSHPYFASYALGAFTRLEKENKNKPEEIDKIERLRNAIVGPLGSLGDQVFWATIKPAVLLLGTLAIFLSPNNFWRITLLLLCLILYNVPHFFIRWRGMLQGFDEGLMVCRILKTENFKKLKRAYSAIGLVCISILSGYILSQNFLVDWVEFLLFIICFITAFILKVKLAKVYYAVSIPIIIGLIWGVFFS